MQAASIVMSMFSTKTIIPGNGLSGKPAPDAPTFAQAFAEKVSATPPPQNASPSRNVPPPKVAPTVDSAVPVVRRAVKETDSQAKGSSRQPVQVDVSSTAQVIPLASVATQSVTVETLSAPSEQATSQTQASPQVNTQGNAQFTPQANLQTNSQAAATQPESPAHSVTAGVESSRVIVMPQVAPPAEALPAAAPEPAEKSSAVTQAAQPNPTAEKTEAAPVAAVPPSAEAEITALLPEGPTTSSPSNANAPWQQQASSVSPETPPVAMATQAPMPASSAKPANSSKNQPSVSAFVPQREAARTQTVPAHNSVPLAAPSFRAPAEVAGKAETQLHTIAVKVAVGAENITTKASQAVVGAAPAIASKAVAQGSLTDGQTGSPQDNPQQKSTGARPVENANNDDAASNEAVPPTEPKASDTAPPVSLTAAPPPITAPPAQVAIVNPAPASATSPSNSAFAPVINEHTAGLTPGKDTSLADSLTDASPHMPQNSNAPELPGAPGVTHAQIAGNTAQSEIHLAMQADKLGTVELHARVTGEQVGAAIVVEKKEAHTALAVELPTLQQALSEKNLRVEHVWLTQSTLHAPAGDAGSTADQRPRSQQRPSQHPEENDEVSPYLSATTMESNTIFDDQGRLSVRA
jgi:hypothetical protein